MLHKIILHKNITSPSHLRARNLKFPLGITDISKMGSVVYETLLGSDSTASYWALKPSLRGMNAPYVQVFSAKRLRLLL